MAQRRRPGNAAVVIAAKEEAKQAILGPVRTALTELVRTRVQPETDKATAAIQTAKEAHEAALDAHAETKDEASKGAVQQTWLAMQAAPAIARRLTHVVLPRTTALIDSDDAKEADQLLTDGGSRQAFKVTLDEHLSLVREQAAALAATLTKAHDALQEHTSANRHVASLLVPINRELATLVSTSCTVESLVPRGSLEAYDSRNCRLALARAVKGALLEGLGRTRSKNFIEFINLVSLDAAK